MSNTDDFMDKIDSFKKAMAFKEELQKNYPKWTSIKKLAKVCDEEEPFVYDVMYQIIQAGAGEQSATRDGTVVYRFKEPKE